MQEPLRNRLYRFMRYLENRLQAGSVSPDTGWPHVAMALLAIAGPAVTSDDPEQWARVRTLLVLLVLLLLALALAIAAAGGPSGIAAAVLLL